MRKVPLIFQGVSEILEGPELGLITLTDKMKERQITIVCDKAMEYQFGLRLNPKTRTDRLLPEVLTTVVKQQGEMRFEVLISDVVDGEYRCLLVNESTFESLPMRASDAILFALISNTPIYIDYNLMMRQSVRYSANANGMAIPINALSDSMLKKSMENAIADENYELASYLRDEINKRKRSEKKNTDDNIDDIIDNIVGPKDDNAKDRPTDGDDDDDNDVFPF